MIEDMHAPARFWGDPDGADPAAVEQALRLCKLPFTVAASFMPNLGADSGFPTGTVLATDGYVIPHGLSADLGCGMAAARTSVSASELTARPAGRVSALRTVLDELAVQVPAGDGPGGSHTVAQDQSMDDFWREILPVPGLGHPAPTELVEAKAELSRLLAKAPDRLGTLGGGHHFLELQADAEDRVWIVAHTGSRGVGAAVCRLYDGLAAGLNERWLSLVPGRPVLPGARESRTRDVAFLPSGFADGQAFLKWASFCLVYATENRARLIAQAEALMLARLPGERTDYIDTPHTMVQTERHRGRMVVMHRKGAPRAEPGTPACVAGSALTGNLIVEGLGDEDALFSVPHGAGRRGAAGTPEALLSRGSVLDALTTARERTMADLHGAGVEVATRDGALLLSSDDMGGPPGKAPPMLDALARPVHRLRPLGLYRT